ncbi:hypothetical protein TeGR_g53, partial [Tetraparma gracilis]
MNIQQMQRSKYESSTEAALDKSQTTAMVMNGEALIRNEETVHNYYLNDKVIMQLELDAGARTAAVFSAASKMCFLPCFLPHALILCVPCTVCCAAAGMPAQTAAHRLYLTERTLRLEVDEHTQHTYVPGPICQYVCGSPQIARYSKTIRLKDVEKCEMVYPVPVDPCGACICGVPT